MNIWEAEITEDDLPDNFKPLAKEIGLPAVLKVVRAFEGSEVYFPKLNGPAGFQAARDRWLRKNDRRHNRRELAHSVGLTLSQLREILGDERQPQLFSG